MKLMIMGDLHYPGELVDADDRMNEARDTFFGQYLQEFLAAEADYYISVGDLTHAGSASEFKFIMQNVEQALPDSPGRFLYVLGNHDTHACSKTDIQNLTGQPRYMAIEEAEAVILLLDTARETPEDWSGAIDEDQLEWLRSQMTQYGHKPLLVFAHHPVYNTTARSTEPMMSLEPDLDLLSILDKHQGPGIFFSGHNHVRSMIRRGSWSFVQTTAVPDAPEATVINLQGEDIRIETVQLCAAQYRELAEIFVKSMYDYDPRPYVEEEAIEEGSA